MRTNKRSVPRDYSRIKTVMNIMTFIVCIFPIFTGCLNIITAK